MLSSMNVTVIPFLLGALMSVEDVEEWNFGPEYMFELTKSIKVYMEQEIYVGGKVTAMVKCRPKVLSQNVQNVLFCRASNITVLNITRHKYENWKHIIDGTKSIIPHNESNKIRNQLFKIEFGRQGVHNFKVKRRKTKQHHYDIITDIIDQFNIGIDLSAARDSMKNKNNVQRPYVIFTFTQYEEDTTRATKCNTSGSITYTSSDHYNKGRKNMIEKNKTEFGFHFKLLPISYTHPANRTFLIERIRKACTHQPQYLMLFNEKWEIHNMTRYFNRMEIRDEKPKFTSYTHLEGNVSSPNSFKYNFSEDVFLHLFRIRPARVELNTAEYE